MAVSGLLISPPATREFVPRLGRSSKLEKTLARKIFRAW